MKVQELRQLLSKADREHLEKAFAESYKRLTKNQKEDVDPVISDILEGKESKASGKKAQIPFEELKNQIEVFLSNAYEQNYFAPNRVIPKSQRPKWRFLVKGYIKELEKILPESEDYPAAVKLLSDLYRMICYACNYYLFSTDDPFRSIGWRQSDFFQLLVKKTFEMGYTRENISEMLLAAATGGLSRESLHIEQEMVLINALQTTDVKYMAVEEAKKLIDGRNAKLAKLTKYDDKRYGLEDTVNNLCDVILIVSILLAEPEDAVKYYFKNCREYSREIILYRALEVARFMEEDGLWLDIYKYGLSKKITPRSSLQKEYQSRAAKWHQEENGD